MVDMLIQTLKSKIHRAAVTEVNVDYVGSITIDPALMDAAGIAEFEKVLVANITNGGRFETYAVNGKRNSGAICMNGAAAKLAKAGDMVIILAFALAEPDEKITPKMVLVDGKNRIVKLLNE